MEDNDQRPSRRIADKDLHILYAEMMSLHADVRLVKKDVERMEKHLEAKASSEELKRLEDEIETKVSKAVAAPFFAVVAAACAMILVTVWTAWIKGALVP